MAAKKKEEAEKTAKEEEQKFFNSEEYKKQEEEKTKREEVAKKEEAKREEAEKEEEARISAARERMMSNFYALGTLVVLFLCTMALLLMMFLPVKGMADQFVHILGMADNKPWLMLGAVLFLTIGGYYFYSSGHFWVCATAFSYLAFFF